MNSLVSFCLSSLGHYNYSWIKLITKSIATPLGGGGGAQKGQKSVKKKLQKHYGRLEKKAKQFEWKRKLYFAFHPTHPKKSQVKPFFITVTLSHWSNWIHFVNGWVNGESEGDEALRRKYREEVLKCSGITGHKTFYNP